MSQAQVGSALDLDAPAALLRMAAGYRLSQGIYVAARLGIADLLRDGPRTAEELARQAEAHAPSLARLLRTLVAFGILHEAEPDRFALTPLGACLRADAQALTVLRSCRRAMSRDATLLLIERVISLQDSSPASAQEQTLADLNMLVRTGGRERTQQEYGMLLAAAGFALVSVTPTRTEFSVVKGAPVE